MPHSLLQYAYFFQQEGRIDILIFIKNVYAIRQGDLNKNLKCRHLGLPTGGG